MCIAPETCTGCGAVVLHKDGWAFDEKPFCKPLCADRWARTRNDDDAAPDRVIERESNGPHVAPCSCEESLALRRRLRAAEKLLTDAQKVALALVNYGDEFAVAGALSGGIRSALRALHGEL